MVPNIEYQGFLRFVSRARQEFVAWFGPYCNYDPNKITFMAAREWDGMVDDEKHFFIKYHKLRSRFGEKRAPSGHSPFICYLLLKRYGNFPSIHSTSHGLTKTLFHPQSAKFHSEEWKALPEQEREQYANMTISELGIEHVMEKRNQLHQLYNPKDLNILEFILKTRPKRPISSNSWFLIRESLSINSLAAKEKWANLEQADKDFYNQCAWLDKKRYNFEKSAWLTNLLSIDLEGDNFTLADFETHKSSLYSTEKVISIIEQRRDLIPTPQELKQPLSAFSLFIRDYREQTKHMVPKFKFGRHLQESSAAWALLPEEKKQSYKDESKRLRESLKNDKLVRCDASKKQATMVTDFFRTSKSVTGPCRPSHLLSRVPTVVNIYGKVNKIGQKDRQQAWNSLPDHEKEKFLKVYEQTKIAIELENDKVKEKLRRVKELIERAKELEQKKREMYLLRNRKMSVREIRHIVNKSQTLVN